MVNLYTAEWSRGGVTNEFRLKVPGIDARMMLLFDALQEKLQKKIVSLLTDQFNGKEIE